MKLTEEEFKRCLPKGMDKRVNKELMTQVNHTLSDPNTAEMLRDNILGYMDVLQDGKFKISNYIDAVKYVSYKLMGNTNIVAYVKTFPDKYNRFVSSGVSQKDIASYVTAYNKSKLVNLILEQSLVPTYILNADIYQKAINTQAALMMDANISPKVRSDAANSILNHLKRPETTKVEMNVGLKESDLLNELKDITMGLARQQHAAISAGGTSPKEVAEQKIIQGEYEKVDSDE